MIKTCFTNNYFQISLYRQGDTIVLNVSSDYSQSSRKSRLWVDQKTLSERLLSTWRSITSRKLKSLHVSFGEIDYYDNMTDMYEVPTFLIERGMRKVHVGSNRHGCIPKYWSIDLSARFEDMRVITPIMEVVKSCLSLSTEEETKLIKTIRPFLQKKQNNVGFYKD